MSCSNPPTCGMSRCATRGFLKGSKWEAASRVARERERRVLANFYEAFKNFSIITGEGFLHFDVVS